MEIDRVPLPLKSFPIDAASRSAGLPADPAERDPHLREEAADKPGLRCSRYGQDAVSAETRVEAGSEGPMPAQMGCAYIKGDVHATRGRSRFKAAFPGPRDSDRRRARCSSELS